MSMSSCPRGCGEEAGRYTAVQRCRARTWHTGCSTCNTTQVRTQGCGKASSPLPCACQGKSLESWARSCTNLLRSGHVEQVVEVLVAGPQQGPDGARALGDVVHLPLAGAVPQEGPVEAGVRVLHQLHLGHRGTATLRATGKRGHIFPSSGMAHALSTLGDLTAVLASTLGRTGIT